MPSAADRDALIASAQRIGANPLDLATVMSFESGMSPSIRGGSGNRHIGLIQFGIAGLLGGGQDGGEQQGGGQGRDDGGSLLRNAEPRRRRAFGFAPLQFKGLRA